MFNTPPGIRKTINWSHERGSWQYDLLCLLIIVVIFLVPGRFFGDRDRLGLQGATPEIGTGKVQQLTISVETLNQFLRQEERADLVDFPVEALGLYLREQYNRPVRLLRYELFSGAPNEAFYRVWFE